MTLVLMKQSTYLNFAFAAGCLFCLAGCLPEDTFLAIRFSPNGQLLAIVSEKQGLMVADPLRAENRVVASGKIHPDNVAWTTDSLTIAFAGDRGGSTNIYLGALDGSTTRITAMPSLQFNPMISGNSLLFLSTESGEAELASIRLDAGVEDTGVLFPTVAGLVKPVLSPSGQFIATFGFKNLRPQIFSINVSTGETDQMTSETDPFSLVTGSLSWTPDDSGIGFLRSRDADIETTSTEGDAALPGEGTSNVPSGSSFSVISRTPPFPEQLIIRGSKGMQNPRFNSEGSLVFFHNKKLIISPAKGGDRLLSMDLPASLPEPGGAKETIAFVAANQLIGITSPSLERAHILTFDLEDKFLLAEEYYRLGSRSKSYDIYQELAASIRRTRDPQMTRFVYIANLRRLGRTDKAVDELENLLAENTNVEGVPRQFLWRVLGYSYLLELNDFDKAAESLRRYKELTSTTGTSRSDSALNALDILEQTTSETARLYASAVQARLDGDFALTNERFGSLLTVAPHVPAVQREYLNALEGFDTEVYYFSPSQRPFRPTRAEKADYFQSFVDKVSTGSALIRDARLDLFLLRIETGHFKQARALLREALTSGTVNEKPEGILEIFRNYLETPEPQPWINQAIPEVFLHPDIRPRLEALTTAPADRLLLLVAAAKAALLQNTPDQARREADAAVAEWNRLPTENQTGDNAALYGRLLVQGAREAELRGLYSEAAESYDRAVNLLSEKHVDNFEMQEEIRYRAALLRAFVADNPAMLKRLGEIELQTGVEVVNPNWDMESLVKAVRDYVQIYDTTSGALRQWSAYEAGVHFGKLHRNAQARAALILACSESPPEYLQRKAMLELAAIDEYESDAWNAARWYSRIATLAGTEADIKMWCSYQIARLHLSINHKIPEARDALSIIVSNRPDTPLAIQAQELLISTSIR